MAVGVMAVIGEIRHVALCVVMRHVALCVVMSVVVSVIGPVSVVSGLHCRTSLMYA